MARVLPPRVLFALTLLLLVTLVACADAPEPPRVRPMTVLPDPDATVGAEGGDAAAHDAAVMNEVPPDAAAPLDASPPPPDAGVIAADASEVVADAGVDDLTAEAMRALCRQLVELKCGAITPCQCGSMAVVDQCRRGIASCDLFPTPSTRAAIEAGTLTFHAARAQPLVDEVTRRAQACEPVASVVWSPAEHALFGALITGAGAEGDACTGTLYIDLRGNSSCGEGLTCLGGVCRQPVPAGGACTATSFCSDPREHCDLGVGRCVGPAGDGAACTSARDCASQACQGGRCAGPLAAARPARMPVGAPRGLAAQGCAGLPRPSAPPAAARPSAHPGPAWWARARPTWRARARPARATSSARTRPAAPTATACRRCV